VTRGQIPETTIGRGKKMVAQEKRVVYFLQVLCESCKTGYHRNLLLFFWGAIKKNKQLDRRLYRKEFTSSTASNVRLDTSNGSHLNCGGASRGIPNRGVKPVNKSQVFGDCLPGTSRSEARGNHFFKVAKDNVVSLQREKTTMEKRPSTTQPGKKTRCQKGEPGLGHTAGLRPYRDAAANRKTEQ